MAAWILFGILLIIDVSMGFPGYGIIALIIISLGLLSKKNRAKRKKLVLAYLSEILIVFVFYQVQLRMNEREGEKIVLALEQYVQNKGLYPNQLTELTPKFIEKIPKVKRGFSYGNFGYYRDKEDVKKYRLLFAWFPLSWVTHRSEKKEWTIDSLK